MHFKWDSNVARDIASELNRLEEELSACTADVEHCSTILREMQEGELSELIGQYVSLTGKMKKRLMELEDCFQRTERGITRANEMFENTELELRRKANGIVDDGMVPWANIVGPGVRNPSPLFYNIPGASEFIPLGVEAIAPGSPWPVLPDIRQTVVIDQVSINSGVVMPVWLQSAINAENVR